ncbi:hypothetical protein [Streptomyces sp. WM6378]|uniref:hypothetical protein n=1 Tax=Streptomyces sp. WM6378 TaxID=1415557 RepID=UPI0006AD8FA7|nr:hypothetical protein [Streptomyces sp. WM6378]KOU52331.1 hypothetical protein ADK54_07670 [Streptomyces sp. WM6378]
MSSRDEQGLTTSRTRPKTQPPTDGLLQLHPTFERFLRAVDDEVETRITEDEIERRLSRIKEARPPREAPPERIASQELAAREQWAAYGYHVVRLWLAGLAASTGGQAAALGLTLDDVDPLAVETVARAVNSFRDQAVRADRVPRPADAGPEQRVAFLVECVRHLPDAQRSRRLMGEHIPYDEFEDEGAVEIVQALYGCVAPGRADALRRVGGEEDWPGQTEEVIALTPVAIRAAAQRYPEVVDPTVMP